MIKRIFGKNLEIFEITTPFETESNNVNNGVCNEVSNLFFCRRTDFGKQVLNNLETSRRLHPLESGLHRARKCSFGLLQVFKWKIKCAFIVNITFYYLSIILKYFTSKEPLSGDQLPQLAETKRKLPKIVSFNQIAFIFGPFSIERMS